MYYPLSSGWEMRMEYPFFSIFKKSFQPRISFFLQMNGRISWSGLAEQSLPAMQIFKKIPVIPWSLGSGHLIVDRL
ncbi:hypothetical protein POTOM_024839 [Populus tomentosa]|uniref:Uncharacterized protein n=1 Tax=Populus tomentosa TaxID=118781 RepID=A0A8X8CWV6_POPTO|nr:hypothetical protein POTOM_024839 [Populus tomentosa]